SGAAWSGSGARKPGAPHAASDAFWQVADDQHHEEAVENQVADEEALAEELPDRRQEDGADHRADDGGEAADHGDEDHLDRERDGKDRVRVDVAVVEAVEASAQ